MVLLSDGTNTAAEKNMKEEHQKPSIHIYVRERERGKGRKLTKKKNPISTKSHQIITFRPCAILVSCFALPRLAFNNFCQNPHSASHKAEKYTPAVQFIQSLLLPRLLRTHKPNKPKMKTTKNHHKMD